MVFSYYTTKKINKFLSWGMLGDPTNTPTVKNWFIPQASHSRTHILSNIKKWF